MFKKEYILYLILVREILISVLFILVFTFVPGKSSNTISFSVPMTNYTILILSDNETYIMNEISE